MHIMKWQTQLVVIFTACLFLASVIYLVRKKALKEEYSLLWLTTSVVIVLASLFAGDILSVFKFINPDSYGDILFFLIIVAQLGFILLFSVKLSVVKDQNKNLAQSVALLRRRLERVESPPDFGKEKEKQQIKRRVRGSVLPRRRAK